MTVIWHNPRCSKSRDTLALLKRHAPDIRLYLQDPPSADDIRTVLRQLDAKPADMIRRGEKMFKELGLKDADDAALINAMAAHPLLIERPIVIHDDKAAIGRPPEDVLTLF